MGIGKFKKPSVGKSIDINYSKIIPDFINSNEEEEEIVKTLNNMNYGDVQKALKISNKHINSNNKNNYKIDSHFFYDNNKQVVNIEFKTLLSYKIITLEMPIGETGEDQLKYHKMLCNNISSITK